MSNILVRPPQLRSTAETIRQKARTLRTTLEKVDQILKGLGADQFEGARAATLRSRYSQTRAKIVNAPGVIETFAKELDTTAQIFEKADKNMDTGTTPMIPLPIPFPTPTPVKPFPLPTITPPKKDLPGDINYFDGKTYADGTYNPSNSYSARPVNPPVTNAAGDRDPDIYNNVLNQFGVESKSSL